MRSRHRVLVLLLASALPAALPPLLAATVREVVQSGEEFPEALHPGAIARVCAGSEDELREDFAARGAPLVPELIERRRGRRCHVDYEPTIPGFRADPDDRPIRELFMNVDSLSFLARRERVYGDALDISKALVKRLPLGISVTLGTRWESTEARYAEATAFHYGDRGLQIEWRKSRVGSLVNPWTQDYLKSGRVAGEKRILVTRRLFEGHRHHGEEFRPMLDALAEERFTRSRLSWEGGDLQFVRHPLHPDVLVLFFGDSAKFYWGKDLTDEEYAYVLRREFGADLSIDLSHLAPHVDYFVAFLPADRIALVSQPVTGNRDLAHAAAVALEERFEGSPPAILSELRERLGQNDAFTRGRGRVEKALARAKKDAQAGWPRVEEPGLADRAARYIAGHCPQSPSECLEGKSIDHLLETETTLLRDWAQAALRNHTESLMDLRLLSLIESQLSRDPAPTQGLIDAKVKELERLGFQVVPVPRLGGFDKSLGEPWSGISYVNSLLVDHVLFVPRFGLGAAEERILDDLDRALPAAYEVVPVPARHMLLSGGGVHCTVAIVRD